MMYSYFRGTAWDLYSTFGLKERHGFNKMTMGLWIKDQIKVLFLSIILGAPIFWIIMKVIDWGGEHFYFYLFATYTIILLIMISIVPNYIMPMFNTYKDLEEGTLK